MESVGIVDTKETAVGLVDNVDSFFARNVDNSRKM